MTSAVNMRLAKTLAAMRAAKGWTLDQLAAQSGVSRAALSRLENAEVSPSIDVLARLADAHEMALSRLLARIEEAGAAHARRDEQQVMRDEVSGAAWRFLSARSAAFAAELTEVTLPAGSELRQPAAHGPEHHIVMLSGYMTGFVDTDPRALGPGDVLRFRQYGALRFVTEKGQGARFLLCSVDG